ncbi:unnamed protein product [Anisakis simplex]|uniref:3Beta_HSD domain-containing protein n=1 Tax=Anisakis simplex TaxID=6269 RepID=A0A0M3K779_ANISI|nr:unnamed protein product [Anisakis simplex]
MDRCRVNGVKRLVYASSVGVIFANTELYDADEDTPYPHPSKFAEANRTDSQRENSVRSCEPIPNTKILFALANRFLPRKFRSRQANALDCEPAKLPYFKYFQYCSHYSASKAIAEQSVLAANCDQLRTCALRYRGIYGPAEPRSVERAVGFCNRGLLMASFEKSPGCLTQYSGVGNSAMAMRLAEEALRQGRAAGRVYNIVDGGPPVGAFSFWFPLMQALGKPLPYIKLPYQLMICLAVLFEYLYLWLGIEPLFTRLEINLTAITNTYSIERARKELHYEPMQNHDLTPTILYYNATKNSSTTTSNSNSSRICDNLNLKSAEKLRYFWRFHKKDRRGYLLASVAILLLWLFISWLL